MILFCLKRASGEPEAAQIVFEVTNADRESTRCSNFHIWQWRYFKVHQRRLIDRERLVDAVDSGYGKSSI